MAKLYRKSAIERLSSPEQLDKALKITSPVSWAALIGITIILIVTGIWAVKGSLPTTLDTKGIIVGPESTSAVYSTVTGDVRDVWVEKGEKLSVGEKIVDIKKRNGKVITVKAKKSGYVDDILVQYWDEIDKGDEIIRVTPKTDEDEIVVLYVPFSSIQKIEKGMEVYIYPTALDRQKYGHMVANVFRIEDAPVSVENMKYVLGTNNMMADEFTKNGAIVAVLCKLKHDENTASGYYWSTDNSKDIVLDSSTLVEGKFVVDESAPITKLIPEFVNN